MLNWFLLALLGYVILCSIIQVVVTSRLATVFGSRMTPPEDLGVPKAAVILAIRGPDPSLQATVRALANQAYPDYKLFVVIDHVEDPAWSIVEGICAEFPDRIQISALRKPLVTCSLKNSSMAQALSELDSSYEMVAFADGDMLVHKTWLRELVQPLTDPNIQVSTGNRWYLPSDAGLGSMSRYFWNVGVVVQLWLNEFVLPGSMAARSDALKKMELVDALRTSLFDGPAFMRQIRRAGFKVQFVPSVMIANREQISLRDFTAWVERQTVVLGTAEKGNWYLLAFNALHVCICVFAPLLAIFMGLWTSEPRLLHWALFTAGCYWGVMSLSVMVLERAVRGVLHVDRKELRWFTWQKAISAAPGLLLAHLIPMVALARAATRRTVRWRGIVYEIRGPGDVRMLDYTPFKEQMAPDRSVL